MSRLAADGWLERDKVGRNSFYRLVKKGRQTFDAATQHIYDPPPLGLDRTFRAGADRRRRRARQPPARPSQNAGFGSPLPGVWVAPSGVPVPAEAADAIRLEVAASEDDSGRRLVAASWPLDRTADVYLKFVETFAPLHSWVAGASDVAPADAMLARILLIHHYRRVVLRDPLLPPALLPPDWPRRRRGRRAPGSIARCCRRRSNGSTATARAGRPAAPPGDALRRRFLDA